MATAKRSECDLWMWDGAAEYEGLLLTLDQSAFSARIRQAKKKAVTSVTGLGKRLPASTPDAQRHLARRKFLAHVAGTSEGTLFEAEIENVQVTGEGEYEYLISGRFGALDEKQLESLRRVSIESAATLLQRHVS
jgi:hypothetical protein